MFRAALLFGLLCAQALPASADCDHFKWSVAKARDAFATAKPLAAVSSGAELGEGYAVKLNKDLALPNKPERDAKPGTLAAVLTLAKIEAGTYQVTVSKDAWIDVFQGGKVVKSSDFSGQHDCPQVRKSVRFTLAPGEATLEISNAEVETLNLVVEPAP